MNDSKQDELQKYLEEKAEQEDEAIFHCSYIGS